MYTICNNNNPMSAKIKDKIWTLGQYDSESGYNRCDRWSIFDINSQIMNYIDIPENIELGNINIILKSIYSENIIYIAAGPIIKWSDDSTEYDSEVSNNPILYSYDINTNFWFNLKTFSRSLTLYALFEKMTGELILIGQCEDNKYVLLSSLQNYQEIDLNELKGKFGYSFFIDKKDELWVYGGLDNQLIYHNAFQKINVLSGVISDTKNISSFDFRSFPLIVFRNDNFFIIGGTKDGYYSTSEVIKYDLNNSSLKSIVNIQNITNGYFVNYCIGEDENDLFIASGYIFNDKIRKYQFMEYKINKISLV